MLSFNTRCTVNKPRWSLNVIKEKRAARIARMSFCGFPHFEFSKLQLYKLLNMLASHS